MEEEEFLLLDDDDEPKSSIPEKESTAKKPTNSESKEIISNISKTVGNRIIQFKESNDLKKLLEDGKENLISFSRSADNLFDADLVIDGTYEIEWEIDGMDCADCAMKATRAVNRLPGIHKVIVSRYGQRKSFSCKLSTGKFRP